MAKVRITKRAIEAAKGEAIASGKASFLWDSDLQGFGARVSNTGAVSWLAQKWIGGRGGAPKRITIGSYPLISIDDARGLAAKEVADATGIGAAMPIDIVARKKEKLSAVKSIIQAGTLGEATEAYLVKKGDESKYWAENKRLFEKDVLPNLGKGTSIASITKVQVRDLIEAKEYAPGTARYLFSILRPFFKWCVERDLISASPMETLKAPPLLKPRDRVLTESEIVAFWHGCAELDYPFGPLFKLLLLTGARREEMSALRWNELDLNNRTWTIPRERTKNGKGHIIHLSEQAQAILAGLPHHNELVFTTTGKTNVSGYSRAKRKLDSFMAKQLGKELEEWRLHDLRRTAASSMAMLGFPPHIVERVLNHLSGAQGGLVSVYQRHEYVNERRNALGALGNYIDRLLSTSTNLVEFKRA